MSKPDRPDELMEIVHSAHEWRRLMSSRTSTDMDRVRFETWIDADPRHEEIYGRVVTFWAAFDHISESDLDPPVFEPTFRERLSSLAARTADLLGKRKPFIAATGAIVLGALALILVPHLHTLQSRPTVSEPVIAVYASGIGEIRVIHLQDGSSVTLGAATTIETSYSDHARIVHLRNGAAYFDVAEDSDRPFSVEAEEFTATALGTAFDVSHNGGVFRVAVAEGDVAVAYPYHIDGKRSSLVSRKELSAGQQVAATKDDGLQPVRPINAASVSAWRTGQLIYDGAPLHEIVADLNRYSETPIRIADDATSIAGLRVRGGFNVDDIDGLLAATEIIHPVIIDRNASDVIVIRIREP